MFDSRSVIGKRHDGATMFGDFSHGVRLSNGCKKIFYDTAMGCNFVYMLIRSKDVLTSIKIVVFLLKLLLLELQVF